MNESDLIRKQMALIRHDLHKDISGVRGDVEQALDWRSLPRHYPLASVLIALAAGYAFVPRRAHQNGVALSEAESVSVGRSRPQRGIGAHALGLLWPIAEQAIQTYAAIWLESRIRRYLGPGPAGGERSAEDRQGKASEMDFFFVKPSERR